MSRFDWLITSYPTIQWINRQLERRLTTGGKVFLLGTLFFAVGATHLDSPVYLLLASAISLFFIAWVASIYYRPVLGQKIRLPEFAVAGEENLLVVRLSNHAAKTSQDLDVYVTGNSRVSSSASEREPRNIPLLRSGQACSVSIPFVAFQRGMLECPRLTCKTAYPFYLIHSKISLQTSGKFPVVPEYRGIPEIEFITNFVAQLSGDRNRSRALADQEFIGSREYLPGMETRRWDYAAWARLQVPHVCQFEEEGQRRVSLVFDRGQPGLDIDAFESAISFFLALTDTLLEHDFRVDRIAIADRLMDLSNMPPSTVWREVCCEMATVEPGDKHQLENLDTDCLANQLVILITGRKGSATETLVRKLHAADTSCELFDLSQRELTNSTHTQSESDRSLPMEVNGESK